MGEWINKNNIKAKKTRILRRMPRRNSLEFGMVTYPDHLQNWLHFGHGLIFFLILAPLWLSEMGQIWGSLVFWGDHMKQWPEIWHADVCWPPSELIRFWSQFVDSHHFGATLKFWHADVSWPPSKLIIFWSWFVDFPRFGDIFMS